MKGPAGLSRLVFSSLEGTRLDPASRRFLADLRPGGVVLFSANVSSLEQLWTLAGEIRSADPEIVIAIDQEGGPVDRLRPLIPSLPAGAALGLTGEPILARRHGELTGELLAALGIDWDLTPVCDLQQSGEDNAIGLRSFGSDPDRAAPMVRAVLEGVESQGVLGCLKHFPGLGRAPADSHLTLPVIPATREDLEIRDIAVFDAVRPAAGAIMVGHGYYPHLTLRGAFPATLSSEIVTALLKQDLGFDGTVVTDDMVMGAVATEELGLAAVRSIEAGTDLLLVCAHDERPARVVEALGEAAGSGRLLPARLDDAFARGARLRARLLHLKRRAGVRPLPQPDWKRVEQIAQAMAELAREVAGRSVRMLRRPPPGERLQGPVVVLRPRLKWLSDECGRPQGSPFQRILAEAGLAASEQVYDSESPLEQLAGRLEAAPPGAFVLATADAHRRPAVQELARALVGRAPVWHLALGWPRDLDEVAVKASVATLGMGWEPVAEGLRHLTGSARPRARLL